MQTPSFLRRLVPLVPVSLRRVIERLRQSFWFLPSISILLAIVVGESVVYFDRSFALTEVSGFGWSETTPDAARGILTTLVGALTSVTGVVLSMMMLILAQTSSQLGPRVVRTVISGNELQATIAAMLATIAFSLTTIRAIRSEDASTAFVPEVATLISVVSFFVSLGTLIYFVNHVSQMIQAPHVIARIARELDRSITANSYEESTRRRTDLEQERLETLNAKTFAVVTRVTAERDGYLQAVDWTELVDVCCDAEVVADVPVFAGSFLRTDQAVCSLRGNAGVSQEHIVAVRRCFFFGERRTPEQDLLAPVMELSEIAVRALSPGINDPRTACMCVDRLTSGILKLARDWQGRRLLVDGDEEPRVVRKLPSVTDALDSAFTNLAHYGSGDPIVKHQLSSAFAALTEADLSEIAIEKARSLQAQVDCRSN